MSAKYKNLQEIIKHSIRKHESEFSVRANKIGRDISPQDGARSYQLLNYLRDSYITNLENTLSSIDDVIINGYRRKDVRQVKNLIIYHYKESIEKNLKFSYYMKIFSDKENSYATNMLNILYGDIESAMSSRAALWTEKIQIRWDREVLDLIKKIFSPLSRLFKFF